MTIQNETIILYQIQYLEGQNMTIKEALEISNNKEVIDGFIDVLQEERKRKQADRIICKQMKAEKILYMTMKEIEALREKKK